MSAGPGEGGGPWARRALTAALIVAAWLLSDLLALPETTLPPIHLVPSLAVMSLYRREGEWPTLLASLSAAALLSALVLHGGDAATLARMLVMAALTAALAWALATRVTKRWNMSLLFLRRSGVMRIFLAVFVSSLILTAPRFALLVLAEGSAFQGRLFFGILMSEASSMLLLAPAFVILRQRRQGGVSLRRPVLLLGLLSLQLSVSLLMLELMSLYPFQIGFLLAVAIIPFIIMSAYMEGLPGCSGSIAVSAVPLLPMLPSATSPSEWGMVMRIVASNLYFTSIALTGLIINSALSETRETILGLNESVADNIDMAMDLLARQVEEAEGEELAPALEAAMRRVSAMAAVHEIISRNGDDRVGMEELVLELWSRMGGPDGGLETGPRLRQAQLGSRTALHLSLVLNELMQNSLRHAFPEGGGKVTVQMQRDHDNWRLLVADDGKGIRGDEAGVGLELVRSLVERQLRGELLLLDSPGTRWLVKFPRSP